MRLIVNKKQYNKILHFQNKKNKLYEGVVNVIYDNIVLYENKLLTETNIRKSNIDKVLKNVGFDTIVLDMFRGELMEVNSNQTDNLLEIDVTLPKNFNHSELKNKIYLEVRKNNLLKEQQDKYGLNMDDLPLGDVIAINYLVDRVRKSLGYSKQQIIDKLSFIDGNNTFPNGGILNIDISKFNDVELNTIIEELEKLNNTNYVLDVDKNGEEIKGIKIDFDSQVALNKVNTDNKKVNTDDTSSTDDTTSTDDTDTDDDFEEVDIDEVPDGSFTSVIPSKLYPVMYLISDMESGHNYNIQSGESSPSVTLTDKTIKQVSKGGDYGTNAKGRWQLMPKYMLGFAKAAGLKGTDKFSKINQDKMAMALIKGWENWDCKKLGDELAHIWAPVPVLYDQQGSVQRVKRGESFYEGVGTNKALTTANKFETALRKTCGKEDNKKVVADDSTDFDKYLTDNGIVPIKPGQGPKKGVQFDRIPGTTDYRSGQPTLGELAWMLQNYDIKRVIRLNDSSETAKKDKSKVPTTEERKLVEAAGAEFYPKTGDFVDAHAGYVKNKGYQQTIKKVLPILEKGNTLIHCRNGADRTGYLVAKYIKDKQKWDNQKLWDYTTEYNSWCRRTEKEFNGSDPETAGGYSSYAQGFIEGVDSDKRYELCDKRNPFDFENEEDSESTTKDDKIKVLIIGDSHSVDNSVNYSRKLLNKKGYSGKIIAKSGEKPKWMYDELLKVKDKIKDYDWFIVFGGGNAAYRSKTDNRAITNLSKIYDLIIKEKGSKETIIAITPPTKEFAYHGEFPSNQTISDWVMSQKNKTKYQYNLSGLKKENFRKQREKNRKTNKMVDTWYHLNGDTHNLILQQLLKDIK